MLSVAPDEALRASLEAKDIAELEGILKLYGPLHNQTDLTSRKRIIRAIEIAASQSGKMDTPEDEVTLNPLVLGVQLERSVRRKRITERLMKRLEEGLVEEVEGLMEQGVSAEKLDYYGLEYRYVSRYILKEMSYDLMVERLNSAIHQFAKRQMTYFRGMERRGTRIHWINGDLALEEMTSEALSLCRSILNIPEDLS